MKYSVRELQSAEEHAPPLAVWLRNFPDPEAFRKRYDWYYRNNPHGVFSYVLTDERACTVGAAGLSARRFLLGGEAQFVGLCSDFSVDPGSRFLRPALQLQRAVLRNGLARFPFIYGFPNDRALGVMMRVGYRRLGQLPHYTLPLRSDYYFRRHPLWPAPTARIVDTLIGAWLRASMIAAPRAEALEEVGAVDSRFDDLWRAAVRAPIMGIRDARFLEWRFLRNPVQRFRIFVLPSDSQALLGYAVVHGDEAGHWHIFDFLVRPGRGVLAALMLGLVRYGLREEVNSINLEFFGLPRAHRVLQALGFRRRRHWRRIVLAPAGDGFPQERLYAPSNWYITSADED